jgi:hypothetical protein
MSPKGNLRVYIGRGKPGVGVPHVHVKAGRTGSGCYSALPLCLVSFSGLCLCLGQGQGQGI